MLGEVSSGGTLLTRGIALLTATADEIQIPGQTIPLHGKSFINRLGMPPWAGSSTDANAYAKSHANYLLQFFALNLFEDHRPEHPHPTGRNRRMKQISDRLYVAPQLTADGIRQARAQGFALIINNRPDGEEPGQPSAADNRSVAEGEQLAYAHIPVTAGQISEGQVRDFQQALSGAKGPVLAHCKTGTRSAILYAIGEVLDGRMGKDQVIPFGQSVGLDLSGAVMWLDAHGR